MTTRSGGLLHHPAALNLRFYSSTTDEYGHGVLGLFIALLNDPRWTPPPTGT